MKISNKKKTALYQTLTTIVLVSPIIGVLLFMYDKILNDSVGWIGYTMLFSPFVLLFLFLLRGKQIFEYDSDGEALNFNNRNVITFLSKSSKDEFPKYKLLKYDVFNGIIFKNLYIHIHSKKSTNSIVLKYEVSYLSKNEITGLKSSLNKILKTNRELNNIRKNTALE